MDTYTVDTPTHHSRLTCLDVQAQDGALEPHSLSAFVQPGSPREASHESEPLTEKLAVSHPVFYFPDGDVTFLVCLLLASTVPNNHTALT